MYFDETTKQWSSDGIKKVNNSLSNGCLSCKISHFSEFAVILINNKEINENGVNVCLVSSGIIIFIAFIFALLWFFGFRFKALHK